MVRGTLSTTLIVPVASLGSSLIDKSNHVAIGSSGCGKASPYAPGAVTKAKGVYNGVEYSWLVYVPSSYDASTAIPLVTQHHGWGMTAESEEKGSGVSTYAESEGFIAVYPQGLGDNPNAGGWTSWYSWNCVGSTLSPGPAGTTCSSKGEHADYCYSSCNCSDACWWTTCNNEVTPSGTGLDATGFVPSLYDTLESQLCIDTTREYAAGESNGGMMTYQLGVTMASRLAAVVVEFGSFHRGFNMIPSVGVPILEFHGTRDKTVPANTSLSDDGYYYVPTEEIFYGNDFAPGGWASANGCSGGEEHYPTSYDGTNSWYCVSAGKCTGGDVVRCSWNGGHNWFGNSASKNGGVVSEFLLKWAKSSHIGFGVTSGQVERSPRLLSDVRILERVAEKSKDSFANIPRSLQAGSHYGNPRDGCLPDEEILQLGSGQTCAPRIDSSIGSDDKDEPVPACVLGGVEPFANGCPTDAVVDSNSKAFAICLAKGNSSTPYTDGQFYCMLACPCDGTEDDPNDCGPVGHTHCPDGARCETGELRMRGQGVCTFPTGQSEMIQI